MEPGVVFGSVNAPVPLGPYVAPPPTFTEPDKAARMHGFLSRRLDGSGGARDFRAGVSRTRAGVRPVGSAIGDATHRAAPPLLPPLVWANRAPGVAS